MTPESSAESPSGESSVPPHPTLAFIGCGAVGRTLGRLLAEAGYPIRGVCCRTEASARAACSFIGSGIPFSRDDTEKAAATASLILIATQDTEIAGAEAAAAPGVARGGVVIHLSGALSSSILCRCREKGLAVGSMHPLQSFADPSSSLELVPGSIFACEGDRRAVDRAMEIARAVGGLPVPIDTRLKALYHAGAAAASNFLIPPLLLSIDLMERAGMARDVALSAIRPLVSGTLQNVFSLGVPRALTGPIERGDIEVVKGHLKAIREQVPEGAEKYRALAAMTLEAAGRKGTVGEQTIRALGQLLKTPLE